MANNPKTVRRKSRVNFKNLKKRQQRTPSEVARGPRGFLRYPLFLPHSLMSFCITERMKSNDLPPLSPADNRIMASHKDRKEGNHGRTSKLRKDWASQERVVMRTSDIGHWKVRVPRVICVFSTRALFLCLR